MMLQIEQFIIRLVIILYIKFFKGFIMLKHQQSLCFVDVLVINNAMYYLKRRNKSYEIITIKIFIKRLIDIINTSIISI